jgi:SPP1 gp7 family putative phage head morphogenesis protein
VADVWNLQKEHRARLLARDEAAAADLTRAWSAAARRLDEEVARVAGRVAEAKATGERVSASWLRRQARYEALRRQVDDEMARLGSGAARRVTAAQRDAISVAVPDAAELVRAARPAVAASFTQLNVGGVEALAGFLSDGTPVDELFRSVAAEGAKVAGDVLAGGLAVGFAPRLVGPRLRDALGVSLTRALTISRTEQLRAYRAANLAAYEQSGVPLYRWVCAKSRRTCPACLAMDGKLFPVSEPFGTHPNCRCSCVPHLDDLPSRETGEEWLARQPEAIQDEILGKAAGEAYRRGEVRLGDFVGEHESERWGTTRYTRGLMQAREAAAVKDSREVRPPGKGFGGKRKGGLPEVQVPPRRSPVSAALDIPDTPLGRRVARAVSVIDAVHDDGELPRIPVVPDDGKDGLGIFRAAWSESADRYVAENLGIFEGTPHPEMTVAHEIGHMIDLTIFGQNQGYGSEDEGMGPMTPWGVAVFRSRAVQTLIRLLDGPDEIDVALDGGDIGVHKVRKDFLAYALQPSELWARSYAQFIAVESGDPEALLQLAEMRVKREVDYPVQWDDDDFAAVARAIGDLLRAQGWR